MEEKFCKKNKGLISVLLAKIPWYKKLYLKCSWAINVGF